MICSREARLRRAGTVLALALLQAACHSGRPSDLGTWVAERDTVGDTVTVRTVSGSVWGKPATLVEDLAIGELDGRDEYMLGQIQDMAVNARGGIYVFDGQVPALRYYDADGKYVRTLGGPGSGPGEYRDASLGLAVRSDGRIVMRDPRNARLNVYNADGTPSGQWPVSSGLFTSQAMVVDTADHAYLRILQEPPQANKAWRIGLLHLDDKGHIVDTIPDPAIAGEPEGGGGRFRPSKVWAWSPLGYMVIGVSDAYHFEVRGPGKRVTRIERTVPAVHVLPEERADYEAANDWMRKNQGRFMTSAIPPIPDTKAPYSGLRIGERGRIWVRRSVTAEHTDAGQPTRPDRPPPITWVEPAVYDVFEPDGTYLGEVHVPRHTGLDVIRGDTAWGTRTGEQGELHIVRLRVTR